MLNKHKKLYFVACVRERRGVYGVFVGNLRQRDHLEDFDINEWILLKWDGGHALDWSGSGYGQMADSCECGDEPLGSIKCWEFLD